MKLQNLLFVTLMAGAIVFSGCGSDKSTTNPIPQDNAPPLAPSGLQVAKADAQSFRAVWDADGGVGLDGYRVYLFDPCPYRDNSYVLLNEDSLLPANFYVYRGEMDEEVWIRVTAVNQSGIESSMSEPLAATAPPRSIEGVTTDPDADPGRRGGPIAVPEPEDRGGDPEHYDRND